jgi:hypothetical protein
VAEAVGVSEGVGVFEGGGVYDAVGVSDGVGVSVGGPGVWLSLGVAVSGAIPKNVGPGKSKRACSKIQPNNPNIRKLTRKISTNVTGEIEMRFPRRPLGFLRFFGFGTGSDSD